MSELTISAQITPNPHTLKFMLSQLLIESGSIDFTNPEKAATSPLAKALFEINGVTGVLIGVNFVSVSKSTQVDWASLAEPITTTLKSVIGQGGTLVDTSLLSSNAHGNSEIETRIKEILDQEIRPAVAMDGGDIIFYGYEDGIVSLHLQGACSSCPSATLTLKMGIENRLKEEFSEIVGVIEV